jgi:hypothetical protein
MESVMTLNEPSKHSRTPNRKEKPDIQPHNPDLGIASSCAISELPPSHAHYRITCQTEKDWWDRKKRWAEVAGLALLAAYTGWTIAMYYANRDAANAAKSAAETASKTLIESNRSWIEIQLPEHWGGTAFERIAQLPRMEVVGLDLPYVNIGRSPVKQIYLEGRADVLDSKQEVVFHYEKPIFQMTHSILFPSRSAAVPIADYLGPFDAVKVTDTLRQELRDGKKYLAFYVRGHFVDDFGVHWVQYCAALTFKDTQFFPYKNCADYNDTGDGTQKQ